MERNPRQEIKVGLAVLGVLLLIGAAVFVLGGSGDLLQDRYRLKASFKDISGLREGAVVRLAGIAVGEVTHIEFKDNVDERTVDVEFNLMERYQKRIRADSIASIQTEGVLGDKYIAISMGTSRQLALTDGQVIETTEPLEWLSYMDKASEILDNSAGISRKINLILGEDQDSARASLANVITTIDTLTKEVEERRGPLHELIYNEQMAADMRASMANLRSGTARLSRMTDEIENGEGFAHEIIYGDEGERLAIQLGSLAETIETLTRDIQNDQSLIHALIYEPDRAEMVTDLHEMARSLREVAESIEAGKGTAGMLANDPALYEDLRTLLGGAQRNKLLKSYIRRTMEMAEQEHGSGWEVED